MSLKYSAVVLALATIATPVQAWAFGGGAGGCTNLPEYYRAQGALQGMTSACDMTIEQARRIVAAQGGQTQYQEAAPAPRVVYRHHRVRPPQQ